MKHQVWIVNSSLLGIFFFALALIQLLQKEAPHLRIIKKLVTPFEKKKEFPLTPETLSKIYIDDIFGTYTPTIPKPIQKSFVTPIPELQAPTITPPPEPPKLDFIEPLNITVKGIILAANETRSVVMIEDETKKEELYHLGEKLKDAQIIKISRNKIIFLRANGQQEIFFLRKADSLLTDDAVDKWKYVIRKIDENNYEVDPNHLKQEVESLGNFIERTSIVGTVFQKGKAIGLKIGQLEENDLGMALGLQQNDILVAVNKLNIGDLESRMKIYDQISQMDVNDFIKLDLKRQGADELITYKLVKISTKKKKVFTGEKIKEDEKPTEAKLKQSRMQEREKTIRDFKQRHSQRSNKETLARIRKRILENLRTRLKNARVR